MGWLAIGRWLSRLGGVLAKVDPVVEMLLITYERDKLYGTVEIKFEAGKVTLLRKLETIKLPACDRNNRDEESRDE